MTKRQAERYMRLLEALSTLGFEQAEVDSLLRCSRVLSTWADHECNGRIQRDETTGKPYWYSTHSGDRISRASDREAGALRRATTMCDRRGVSFYHQGDPRGCAIWILRPGDVPKGKKAEAFYTRGIAVCID